MSVTRRGFLLTGTLAAGATVLPTAAMARERKTKGKSSLPMKLSSQLGVIPGQDLPEKLANMERWGFDGFELPGDAVGGEKKYADAAKKTKLKISAICGAASCADGALVSDVVEKRASAFDNIKRALTSAGELHATGVIFVPAFNGQTKLGNQEIRKILLDKLPELGEHAQKVGSRLIMEPLNRGEAYFLRQVADATRPPSPAIARAPASP
jgi:sugar phosphate isomerase/epimerase